MVTTYGYVGTYATPPHPYPAPMSHGKLRSMLTGTGVAVGSNFRFVVHLLGSVFL